MNRLIALFSGFFMWGCAVSAEEPLSAIDWLSEILENPEILDNKPVSAPIIPQPIQEVFITDGLSGGSPDTLGLLAPEVTGFSANLWGGSATRDIAEAIESFPVRGYPEAQNVFRRILLAQANPPFDVTAQGQILQARMEKLYEIGALDAAEAIYMQLEEFTPALFEQAFRVAILTDRTVDLCALLAQRPALSNDLSTRTYCLARSGDWNAAAVTVSLGASIGAIDRRREEMLIWYLDPEQFEGELFPNAPVPLAAMDFVLREALLMPRANGVAPLPYLYRDIGQHAPLRARLEASERLVRAGSLPGSLLFNAYRTGTPAASGGVWERSIAIQDLDAAFNTGEDTLISAALAYAASQMRAANLLVAFADEYAERLRTLEYSDAYLETAGTICRLLHLANVISPEWHQEEESSERKSVAHLLFAEHPIEAFENTDDIITKAVIDGMSNVPPTTIAARDLQKLLEGGNQGLAIIGALRLLSDKTETDAENLRTALYILRAAGQTNAAKRIAVQILLLSEAPGE